jgi:hypothetical protein
MRTGADKPTTMRLILGLDALTGGTADPPGDLPADAVDYTAAEEADTPESDKVLPSERQVGFGRVAPVRCRTRNRHPLP